MKLPRLYPIIDASFSPDLHSILAAAEQLVNSGCTLLQYRNKSDNARVMLQRARELRRLFPRSENPHFFQNQGEVGHPRSAICEDPDSVCLIMNDRADLCLGADFDGVHVGQDDLSPESVRAIVGPHRWLGVSTHNPEQLREADLTSANYLAIGPVFATSSKQNPDPVVGLEGVRRARALTRKPLVAIGGITRANAASVIEAGADSVAVISDLVREPGKSAEEFFRILR